MCNKERILVSQIIALLKSDKYSIGDRLPSERELAAEFSASRNTLRGAIKVIVASGAVEVKRGSGYFYVSESALESIYLTSDTEEEKSRISDQMEAFFLFEPHAVVLATKRMTDEDKKKLEECVVKMSYSILNNDGGGFVESHKMFHQIIASGTNNRAIAKMLERLEITYSFVANVVIKLSQEERNTIFARHVNLFKAITSGDQEAARKMSLQMILSTSIMLNRFEGIKIPETISREIDDQIIDMKRNIATARDE